MFLSIKACETVSVGVQKRNHESENEHDTTPLTERAWGCPKFIHGNSNSVSDKASCTVDTDKDIRCKIDIFVKTHSFSQDLV